MFLMVTGFESGALGIRPFANATIIRDNSTGAHYKVLSLPYIVCERLTPSRNSGATPPAGDVVMTKRFFRRNIRYTLIHASQILGLSRNTSFPTSTVGAASFEQR